MNKVYGSLHKEIQSCIDQAELPENCTEFLFNPGDVKCLIDKGVAIHIHECDGDSYATLNIVEFLNSSDTTDEHRIAVGECMMQQMRQFNLNEALCIYEKEVYASIQNNIDPDSNADILVHRRILRVLFSLYQQRICLAGMYFSDSRVLSLFSESDIKIAQRDIHHVLDVPYDFHHDGDIDTILSYVDGKVLFDVYRYAKSPNS